MRFLAALLLACLAPAAQAQGSLIDVSGSVAYRQRMALPADAVVVVQVVDTSRTDTPARLLAEKRYTVAGAQAPIPFVLTVDRDLVTPGARIVLRASIERGKKLLFTTDRIYPVLTNDQPAHADLVLVMADGKRTP